MIRHLPVLACLALLGTQLQGQVGLASSARTVVLTATKLGSVRVALHNGGTATLPGGVGAGPSDFAPLPIETSWDLDPSQTSSVSLVAYFQAPGAALSSGAAAIPVSQASAAGSRTDQLQVRIDFTGWPDLPAGHYQGILNLLAITQ